jgi:hypothetical protein
VRRLTSRLLMRDQDDIGVSNSLPVDGWRVLELSWIKHEHHNVVVTAVVQSTPDVTGNGEWRLFYEGEFSPLLGECLNAGENIRKLRATGASMESELFKSLRKSRKIDIHGALVSLVYNYTDLIDVA